MKKKTKTKSFIQQESIWVSKHQKELEKYAGKWIAVLKNKVIASGESVNETMQKVKKQKIKEVPLVTMVPRKDEGYYVLIVLC